MGIGGDNPIRIQSMTTTRASDTEATVAQTIQLVNAGCEIVRITVPTKEEAKNLKNITHTLRSKNIHVPLVADIHFRPEAAMEAADHVDKIRINPGNFDLEKRFSPLVLKLKSLGRALRIGVNHGSLSPRIMNHYGDTPEGMVESALEFIRVCEQHHFHDIVVSMKASNPKITIAAYRLMAARLTQGQMNYPFHLGVTEAGEGEDGRIKSAIGIGSLLEDGIGDTIRVSLTENPECEIPVAKEIAEMYSKVRSAVFRETLCCASWQNPTFCKGRPAPSKSEAQSKKQNTQESQNSSQSSFSLNYIRNAYAYTRRESREIQIGPIRLGGKQPIRTLASLSCKNLPQASEYEKSEDKHPIEILECPVKTRHDIASLQNFKSANEKTGVLARLKGPDALMDKLMDAADAVLFTSVDKKTQKLITRHRQKAFFLEADNAKDLLQLAKAVSPYSQNIILTITGRNHSTLIRQIRRLATYPLVKEPNFPIHIKSDLSDNLLRNAILFGALLCDGLGDSVQIPIMKKNLKNSMELIYNILQGAGARVTKAEYVSCPACGRTLFDIQKVTERIKSKTKHLKNVKIAVMGCIVNGPGEMADADFGYVGAGPDKINLYAGKNCIEKNIPMAHAEDKLIELIKQNGKWTEQG